MSENDVFSHQVDDDNAVDVDVDGFVWEYKLAATLIFKNIHINIINVKFVIQVDNEQLFDFFFSKIKLFEFGILI